MPRRPLPIIPKGKRRRPRAPSRLILGCPKISPEYELAAFRALIKPQFKGAILHRKAEQRWNAQTEEFVFKAVRVIGDRLGWHAQPHFPDDGDYHFVIEVDAAEIESAKALGVLLTRRIDDLWLTLGKWFIHRGKFFKRHRSHNILMTPATTVHLTRAVRNALSGEL